MSRKLTTLEFIEKAISIHGDRYSYDRTEYFGARTKVTVTCKLHGDFQITPDSHVGGRSGCAKCKGRNMSVNRRQTLDDFVRKSVVVHGDKFDYSQVSYVNGRIKVKITCPEHGVFECSPNNHQRGKGCPYCKKSGFRRNLAGYLYVLSDGNITKIGITNRSAETRTKEIIRSSGLNFTKRFSIYFEDGSKAQAIEELTLAWLRFKYEQPTEVFDGSTESFLSVDIPELLNFIASKTKASLEGKLYKIISNYQERQYNV